MLIIFKKELFNYFGTWSAYLVSAIFVLVSTMFLWFFDNEYNVFNLGEASLSTFFFIAPWIFLLLIPAITMKLFAEEKQLGTLEWLVTQPIKMGDVVIGKYLAVLVHILFMLLPTLIFVYSITYFSLDNSIDLGVIMSGYIGLFLLGSFFAAIGLWVSAFTSSQVIAYVASIFICFIFYYGFQGLASYNLLGGLDYYLQQIGIEFHYKSFLKGIIDTRDLAYFILLPSLLLLLTNSTVNNSNVKS